MEPVFIAKLLGVLALFVIPPVIVFSILYPKYTSEIRQRADEIEAAKSDNSKLEKEKKDLNKEVNSLKNKVSNLENTINKGSFRGVTQTSTKVGYSKEECDAQVKALAPEVEVAYVKWYEDFREAKKELTCSGDSTEEELRCTELYSDFNVSWQNKMNDIVADFKKSITKCSSGSIRFSKYSDVISSSY